MLKNLSIKNVALIRHTEIEFTKGLNVLSGETGAGKSVVLEALNFALGQKADKSMICHGERDCSVTCAFDIQNNLSAKQVLEQLGIEADDEIVVRRTLNIDGKSAIRLNGETVTSTMLRRVTSLLVDVHGQSDHFLLLKESNQLSLIDGLGGEKIAHIKDEIASVIDKIKDIDNSLLRLGGDDASRARRLDYLQFAIDEIESADIGANEEENLIERKKKLINLEKISLACSESYETIASEGGISDLLSSVSRKMHNISQYGKEYGELSDRLQTVLEEVTDIAELINDSCDEEFDGSELERIEARLNVLSSLKRKYGKDYNEIQKSLASFHSEYDLISDSAAKTALLTTQRTELLLTLEKAYTKLSDERKIVAADLSDKLSEKLKELAMKSAKFEVDFSVDEGEVLSSKGRDNICFMFTANKGEVLKPLSKIISGGELSRLMLAIKAVTGGNFGAETFIFDEIDVGISGEAAEVVAQNFAKISIDKQIIAISHLPQIVAMADIGFFINKTEQGDRTVTNVLRLDNEGKTLEVVRLVGGTGLSEAATLHAKEMIYKSDQYKKSLTVG